MRHQTATFYVLPVDRLSACKAAIGQVASHRSVADSVERTLCGAASQISTFAHEGVMAAWGLHYLYDIGAYGTPERFYRSDTAKPILANTRCRPGQRVRLFLEFESVASGELATTLSSVAPTETDLFEYERRRIAHALGGLEQADERIRTDGSISDLVTTCHAAFNWLLNSVRQVNPGMAGVLVGRDTRQSRWRWITRL